MLLAGKFGDYKLDAIKHVAVALELIHMASLVHDDVIDAAFLRRSSATVNAKWETVLQCIREIICLQSLLSVLQI